MTNILRFGPIWNAEIETLLGNGVEPVDNVTSRARALYPAAPPIVWECDAKSFNFSYVSEDAEQLLGFGRDLWLEPMFWAQQVVHDADRDDAVNYCMLATQKLRDHMFEYRAKAADGRVLWLRDYVKVVQDESGKPVKLRGVMFDVTAEKLPGQAVPQQHPTREELIASA